jgi:hypothetical protein
VPFGFAPVGESGETERKHRKSAPGLGRPGGFRYLAIRFRLRSNYVGGPLAERDFVAHDTAFTKAGIRRQAGTLQ